MNSCLFAPDLLAFGSSLVEGIAAASFNLVLIGGKFSATPGLERPGIICFSCLLLGQAHVAVAKLPVFAVQKIKLVVV